MNKHVRLLDLVGDFCDDDALSIAVIMHITT